MTYKDQTFCQDWRKKEDCFRNYTHIEDALKPGGFPEQNPWMPVCYFVSPPVDCTERIPK